MSKKKHTRNHSHHDLQTHNPVVAITTVTAAKKTHTTEFNKEIAQLVAKVGIEVAARGLSINESKINNRRNKLQQKQRSPV
ncbi:hypothetical protein CWC22_019350 [Pseudoalteromonas rubra]|uniref:Transposase n=1 Tax=Pseudoalteromonas rubra TaxID=43658 RepID=A0A5S3UXS8_9GAMM|nr:hypothetical protein [Pseudoalteromonas rubra]QPB85025.1 hypothetical protein CWC22_019350 [Pseudoalteromonas rubra]